MLVQVNDRETSLIMFKDKSVTNYLMNREFVLEPTEGLEIIEIIADLFKSKLKIIDKNVLCVETKSEKKVNIYFTEDFLWVGTEKDFYRFQQYSEFE